MLTRLTTVKHNITPTHLHCALCPPSTLPMAIMTSINDMKAFPSTYILSNILIKWICVLFLDDLTTAIVPFPSDFISVTGDVGSPTAKATTVKNFKRGTKVFFAYLFQAGDDRYDLPKNMKKPPGPNGFYACIRIHSEVYGTYVNDSYIGYFKLLASALSRLYCNFDSISPSIAWIIINCPACGCLPHHVY